MKHLPPPEKVPKRESLPPPGTALGPRTEILPPDPTVMLLDRGHGSARRRPGPLFFLLVVGIVAEMFATEDYKPSHVAGQAAARFYGNIMDEDNRKQLELREQDYVAQMLAERQAEYGAWLGRCSMLGIFDLHMAAMCRQAADAFYHDALREVQAARDRYNEGKQ